MESDIGGEKEFFHSIGRNHPGKVKTPLEILLLGLDDPGPGLGIRVNLHSNPCPYLVFQRGIPFEFGKKLSLLEADGPFFTFYLPDSLNQVPVKLEVGHEVLSPVSLPDPQVIIIEEAELLIIQPGRLAGSVSPGLSQKPVGIKV
jgi:hypothetical protein